MSFDDYLALDAANWSTVKELRTSALHYRHRIQRPRKDTAGLRAGRSAHTAVFEPDRFLLDYAVFRHKNKGGKVVRKGKAWDEFKAQHEGQNIITPDEYATALAFRDAVRNHELARPYLERGAAEKTIEWTDPETGLKCKARLDFVSESKPSLVDLKGTGSIVYGTFASTAYRMGYHCQLGFYRWGLREALGLDLPATVIAVEAKAPHDVGVFPYLEDCLDAGLDEVRSLLVKLAYHREKNQWPGMYSEEQVMEFPPYVDASTNDDTSDLGLEP